MGKPVPKTSALVVSAIRKLREAQGSTSREIMNFITAEYDVPAGSTIKRQLQAALKRGLEYGILKRHQGHYTLSTDDGNVSNGGGLTVSTIREDDETGDLVDASCGKKRRKYRKCKKTRRCARGCVPNRRKKKCGNKKRRHRSRGKRGCPKRCGGAGAGGSKIDGDNLVLNPIDESSTQDINVRKSHHSTSRSTRRSRSQSRSQSRSRSRSRSGSRSRSHSRSGNSSRIGGRETSLERREKQAE